MTTEPYDEDKIKGDDVIIRRVNPEHHLVRDESTGRLRTSSKLFSPSSQADGGMSVDVLKLIEQDNLDPKEFVTTPVFIGSLCFKASAAREVDLMVGYDPIKDNPYHGEVWASGARPNKFRGAQKRALAEASEWFVELKDVDIKS